MDLDELKTELEERVAEELAELDAWWRRSRTFWPLAVTLICLILMVVFRQLWVDIFCGIIALAGTIQYAEMARKRLAEVTIKNKRLHNGLTDSQELVSAWRGAATSLHQKLFGPMGIGGGLDKWYNGLWRLAGLDEKGAPDGG